MKLTAQDIRHACCCKDQTRRLRYAPGWGLLVFLLGMGLASQWPIFWWLCISGALVLLLLAVYLIPKERAYDRVYHAIMNNLGGDAEEHY